MGQLEEIERISRIRADLKQQRDHHTCLTARPLIYYLDSNVTRFSAAIPSPRSTDWLTDGWARFILRTSPPPESSRRQPRRASFWTNSRYRFRP